METRQTGKSTRQKLNRFLDRRSHDWQQRLCLITFLVLSFATDVILIPMHIGGLIGQHGDSVLNALSMLTWAYTATVLALFLMRRLSLNTAVSAFGIMMQLTESVRIIYLSTARPEAYEQTIVLNQVISLALIIYLVMSAVRWTPLVITIVSCGTIIFTYVSTDGAINRQIVTIFVLVEAFTCVLGELIRRGIRSLQIENDDYHTTISQLLAAFHMTKPELLSYIQLGRGGMSGKDVNAFFDRLDERTEANLIRSVKIRIAHQRMRHADISTALPTLTPTEREVCRLIIGGKTLAEIAEILDKNTNNISSVRIHIRKKLCLSTGDDLREALLKATQGK